MQRLPAGQQANQADIEKKPWKYLGYQSFSTFVASDNDFFILRKFGALSARVLLALQDQLSELEEKLEALERSARDINTPDVHNGSFRHETCRERAALICNAQRCLQKYSQSSLSFLRSIEGTCFGIDITKLEEYQSPSCAASVSREAFNQRVHIDDEQMNSSSSTLKSELGHKSQRKTFAVSKIGFTTKEMQS